VSCGFSKEALALHVEGDLPEATARAAGQHLETCEACRSFFEELRTRQALLKSLRRESVSPSECTGMRRDVMSIISSRRDRSGWALAIERAIWMGVRRHAYALAAFATLGIISVSVVAHMRPGAPAGRQALALFESRDTLVRPADYRDWVLVGAPDGPNSAGGGHVSSTGTPAVKVYINPSAYRQYIETGTFPEGTLVVRQESSVLLASLKDSSRFEGGWGFFDFTGTPGSAAASAKALPESSGCRACHQRDAQTDHVFTQFYPALRSARLESISSSVVRPERFPGRAAAVVGAG
jgi:hypothetical protein